MDSAENTQEGRFERVREGSAEDAANQILNMWDSQEQTASEETDTPVDEEVVEETEEAEEVEEEAPEEEEGQAEEETEEEVEEEEFDVVAEEDLKYTIKVDGEELEVGIEELKNGYQRQADYTRKSQALAEQRKETEQIQSERQRLEQERQMYANGLQMLQEQQNAKLQEFNSVDWDTLKNEDPYAVHDKERRVQRCTRKSAERSTATTICSTRTNAEQQQAAKAHFVQQEYARLVEALPEWNDKESTIKKDIQEYAAISRLSTRRD
jgi:hypothetical protein